MHTKPVRFVRNHSLYFLASPQFQTLFLGTMYFSLPVQVFKHNGIGIIKNCDFHDKLCSLNGDIMIDTGHEIC